MTNVATTTTQINPTMTDAEQRAYARACGDVSVDQNEHIQDVTSAIVEIKGILIDLDPADALNAGRIERCLDAMLDATAMLARSPHYLCRDLETTDETQ